MDCGLRGRRNKFDLIGIQDGALQATLDNNMHKFVTKSDMIDNK